jgi:integrase
MASARVTTAKEIEALARQPGAGERYVEVKDATQSGLYVRIARPIGAVEGRSAAERITYRAVFKSNGRTVTVTLGKGSELSLAEARRAAAEVQVKGATGTDFTHAKAKLAAEPTFGELGMAWLASKKKAGLSEKYIAESQYRLKRLDTPDMGRFAALKVSAITKRAITKALDGLVQDGGARGNGGRTEAARVGALMRAVLRWGVETGRTTVDPSQGVKPGYSENTRDRVLTDHEVLTFWRGINGLKCDAGTKLAMKLSFVTGQRPKELCELERRGVKLTTDEPSMTITAGSSKNSVEHVVPLHPMAVTLLKEALAAAPDGSRFVFPSPRGAKALDRHALSTALIRARDDKTTDQEAEGARADLFGMVDVQLYDAKRTMATWLGDFGNEGLGYTDQEVGLLLNHLTARSGVTGKHYNKASYIVRKRRMAQEWGDHLAKVVGWVAPADVASGA